MNFSYLSRNPINSAFITPMIDILFILIVFFVMTGSFSDFCNISVSPPAVSSTDKQAGQAQLLEIHADGKIIFSGKEVQSEMILSFISQDLPLTVAVDQEADFSVFASVFSEVSRVCPSIQILCRKKIKSQQ